MGARRREGHETWIVRARRGLGPLMFPGGSIVVGESRHDRNVIMSLFEIIILTDESGIRLKMGESTLTRSPY